MDSTIDTRFFRFGAILPEDQEELAYRLADLEDQLNEAVASLDLPDSIQHIYYIPIVERAPFGTDQEEECRLDEASQSVMIRKRVEPDRLFATFLEELDVLSQELLDLKELLALVHKIINPSSE